MSRNSKKEPPKRSKLADIGLSFLMGVLLVGGAFLVNWAILLLDLEPSYNPLANPLSMETANWFFPLTFLGFFVWCVAVILFRKPPKDKYGKDNLKDFH